MSRWMKVEQAERTAREWQGIIRQQGKCGALWRHHDRTGVYVCERPAEHDGDHVDGNARCPQIVQS